MKSTAGSLLADWLDKKLKLQSMFLLQNSLLWLCWLLMLRVPVDPTRTLTFESSTDARPQHAHGHSRSPFRVPGDGGGVGALQRLSCDVSDITEHFWKRWCRWGGSELVFDKNRKSFWYLCEGSWPDGPNASCWYRQLHVQTGNWTFSVLVFAHSPA